MLIEPQYISFKDPDACVVKSEKGYSRYIYTRYQEQYNHLMNSGLYEELVKVNLLISHREIEIDSDDPRIYKHILPEQINYQSYPFEWSFTQWRKTALAFLKINTIALKFGMILKDATPYNFYLKGGNAILFDTSSFAFFKDNNSWIAYRQFCELFLAPIALMKYNGAKWAKLYMSNLHGLPMKFVSQQLSIKSWMNISCLLHIHLHAKYEGKKANTNSTQKGFTKIQISQLFDLLSQTFHKWKTPYQVPENWIYYYEKGIESEEYLVNKKKTIQQWLEEIKPNSVIDLGANTGLFSLIASKFSAKVVAVESDETCVDAIEREIKKNKIQNLNVIVADLSETTPSLGMLNREYQSFISRSSSEMVLALALVHHLCIIKNLPFKFIAELFSALSKDIVIVEFIPKTDTKVQLLLNYREDIFFEYTEEHFQNAFSDFFYLVKKEIVIGSERILFLFKKK
jgi:predicted nicotinamide N-methyase